VGSIPALLAVSTRPNTQDVIREIEEAKQCEDRIIVLDGSDLVYRMNPVRAEGYFTDEYIAALDWKRAADATNVAPQLPRWGLNRVYGALALVCLDSSGKEELKRDLKTIEIAVGYGVAKRFARYEGGKLIVGLCFYGGDTQGCYEYEIAAALAGRPVD